MKTVFAVTSLVVLSSLLGATEAAVSSQSPAVRAEIPTFRSRESAIGDDADAISIPRLLSYQGKLTDTMGIPVADTLYAVRFRLYAQPTGGTQFWEENQQVRTKSGLFSTLLGSVTPIGSMPDAGAVYLGMAVAGGAELTPRLRIASAAYAYLTERAANSDLLQGRDTTTFSRSNHLHDATYVNEGQADAVTSGMIVNGTIAAADLNQMGAASGQVMKWTGSAWQPRNDSVGSGGGSGTVTSVSQGTGVTCTPNPITTAGTVALNTAYTDGRYVDVTGDSITDDLAVLDELRVYDRARIGPNCQNTALQSFVVGDGCVASGNRASVTGGWQNRVTASDASVAGGAFNLGTGLYSFVGSGYGDTANARYGGALSGYGNLAGDATTDSATVVAGGSGNRATVSYAAVGGGLQNQSSGHASVVAGGYANTASGTRGFVGGGYAGLAAGSFSAVVGGYADTASGDYSAVGGGSQNTVTGSYTTVSGGRNNRVTASYGTISGGYANTSGSYGAVGGGYSNEAVGTYSLIAGGYNNTAVGSYTSVLGGYGNYADNSYSIAAGRQDTAFSFYSAVLSGFGNRAGLFEFETSAVVVAGVNNQARWQYCTVGGGRNNSANGTASTVMGGTECYVGGNWAAAVGLGDTARGGSSFAANARSMVPSGIEYAQSAAFNGQNATGGSQLRCDDLYANSMGLAMDHPLNPDGMILNQYAGAGPEMLLTFRGSAVLDAGGRARVALPAYFAALCRNPMVQLTGVGTSDVYVVEDVAGSAFAIGGKPGTKVYWTVTGERDDQVAKACRILTPVEQPKTGSWVGRSIGDASLANRMPALEEKGAAQDFRFRSPAGRQRYEDLVRLGAFGARGE